MATPQILWFRQDLRLADQPAVRAAAAAGPVLPVYVLDDESPGLRPMGAASRWWLHHSLAALDASLRQMGGGLLVLKGPSAAVLKRLAAETGAGTVHALHHGEPWWRAIEAQVPGLQLHGGVTLVPPGLLRTRTGGRFRLFTPYWRAHVALGAPAVPKVPPARIDFFPQPPGERLEALGLLPVKPDWAKQFNWQPGEVAAQGALSAWLGALDGYERARNFPSEQGTSRLSPHLHFGELSPAQAWHAAVDAVGADAATPWTRQLVWRDFGQESLDQFPDSADRPHRTEFDRMHWTDTAAPEGAALLEAWQKGRTGYPLVDAGMRQLWATGWMHNRVRMVAASFLVKHLLIDWRQGERWFWDTLVDADAANNAMGWQWVMGSGIDSAPYFRIFTPTGQSAKFDGGAYIRRWVPELADVYGSAIHETFTAGHGSYPAPIVDHGTARARALAAYAALKP
jgi:deoxyribodipyrimidine photo-lyase